MQRKQRRGNGFTLIEIVLVMFLTGLVLFMVAQLTSRTMESLRFLQEKSQTLQSATLGLERLSSELREAIGIDSYPAPSLIFRKINPGAPIAFANDPSDPDPLNNWSRTYTNDYNGSNQVGIVTYQLDNVNQTLSRTANLNGATATSEVAVNVNDFKVERGPSPSGVALGPNVFEITLALDEKRKIVTFKSIVTIPSFAL